MSKLFGGGQKAASGGIQGDVLATDNNTVGMGVSCINSAAPTSIYTLSLHDALPISRALGTRLLEGWGREPAPSRTLVLEGAGDRKSTRLNSSHITISYAVFCLKKSTCWWRHV